MLAIENLSVEYYRRGQVIAAVQDFSLAIQPGETVGLVGESGSGKSTVALAILRLIRPQEGRIASGRILFQGENLLAVPDDRMREIRGKRVSMIFQDPFTSLNPVMRIRDQMEECVGAGLRARPQSKSNFGQTQGSAPTHLTDALECVQLDPARVLSSYPHQLSGGQRQRVMIAMALLNQPEFILADEPTTALDVLVQKEILELLFRLQKELKMGVMLITHNLGLVAQYTQRIAVMKEGRLVEEGSSAGVFKSATHPYTRDLIAALPRIDQ